MTDPSELIRDMRASATLSQRALSERAGTSQPAIARYERGVATPAWGTLERIAAACGQRLRLSAEPVPDRHDIELAEGLLRLTPQERLRTLRRFARLRSLAQEMP